MSIPLHPLMVHGTVVLIPLAAVVAAAFTLKPSWRWVLRWPAAVANVLAIIFLFAARITGDSLAEATPDNKDLIEKHDQMAGLLTVATIPMVVALLVACWTLPSSTPLPSGKGAWTARWGVLGTIARWATPVLVVAVLVLVVLTGHTGATAVWSGN